MFPKMLFRRRSFGLNGLDTKLAEQLGHKKRGFFIEAGANNGVNQSNTLYLERYLGWRGLLVEPIPHIAEAARRNRPKAMVENAALVGFDFVGSTVDMRYCNLMSLVKGGMQSAGEEQAHIEIGCAVQRITTYDLTVPARTLQSVLDQRGIVAADLLVLDVEGYEDKVLRGVDFERFRVGHILVEARYRREVDAALDGRFTAVAELSHHDVLYRRHGVNSAA